MEAAGQSTDVREGTTARARLSLSLSLKRPSLNAAPGGGHLAAANHRAPERGIRPFPAARRPTGVTQETQEKFDEVS
jgi:hypothetical protein